MDYTLIFILLIVIIIVLEVLKSWFLPRDLFLLTPFFFFIISVIVLSVGSISLFFQLRELFIQYPDQFSLIQQLYLMLGCVLMIISPFIGRYYSLINKLPIKILIKNQVTAIENVIQILDPYYSHQFFKDIVNPDKILFLEKKGKYIRAFNSVRIKFRNEEQYCVMKDIRGTEICVAKCKFKKRRNFYSIFKVYDYNESEPEGVIFKLIKEGKFNNKDYFLQVDENPLLECFELIDLDKLVSYLGTFNDHLLRRNR